MVFEWSKSCRDNYESSDIEEVEKNSSYDAIEAIQISPSDTLAKEDAVVIIILDAYLADGTVIRLAIDLQLTYVTPVKLWQTLFSLLNSLALGGSLRRR